MGEAYPSCWYWSETRVRWQDEGDRRGLLIQISCIPEKAFSPGELETVYHTVVRVLLGFAMTVLTVATDTHVDII